MVKLEVDGKSPGDEIRLDSARAVTAKCAMTTQATVDRVELVVNGRVADLILAPGRAGQLSGIIEEGASWGMQTFETS